MEEVIIKAIEEYQCSGCSNGGDISCFETNSLGGIGCGKHCAGTMASGIGSFFLGLPKGFNRLGFDDKLQPNIYKTFDESDFDGYDKWNIPTWKYLNKSGHTLVRGHMPRVNMTFLHIYLEDCRDKINCLQITQEDVDGMD